VHQTASAAEGARCNACLPACLLPSGLLQVHRHWQDGGVAEVSCCCWWW
jgi:hypothetical protein